MNLLPAPFYSLFSLQFYRDVLRSSLKQGFIYLTYLSFIATLIALSFLSLQAVPGLDRFVNWAKAEMPTFVWTPEGISLTGENPRTMIHPEYGPLITFDTSATEVTEESMGNVQVFVTAKKAYVKKRPGELRIYDLTQAANQAQKNAAPFTVTPEVVAHFYGMLKPWLYLLTAVFFFPIFFVWKLLAALFYSVMGLLWNLLRKNRLNYASILNAAFFTLTPSLLVQLIFSAAPFLNRVPFGFFGSFILTNVYLYFAILKTVEDGTEIEGNPGQQFY